MFPLELRNYSGRIFTIYIVSSPTSNLPAAAAVTCTVANLSIERDTL